MKPAILTRLWRPLLLILFLIVSHSCNLLEEDSGEAAFFGHIEERYGQTELSGGGLQLGPGGGYPYPSVVRVGPHPADEFWSLELEIYREEFHLMEPGRQAIEDVGVWLGGGRIQIWWGGIWAGGIRVTSLGKMVASNHQVVLENEVHQVGLRVDSKGGLSVTLDGDIALSDIPLESYESAWLELASRNSTVRWHLLESTFLPNQLAAPPETPWTPLPDEPPFDPQEAVYSGYQPFPTHLWNRWLANFVPGSTGWIPYPFWESQEESPVTHGPLLGKPGENLVAVWCRTSRPEQIEIVAGVEDFPRDYRVLGTIQTQGDQNLTGSVRLLSWPFSQQEEVQYSLRVSDRIVDVRDHAGRWPVLRRAWFESDPDRTVRIAVTYGDNLLPVPLPQAALPAWEDRARELDLMIHLGDSVYEQSFRRRPEVSALDYLSIFSFSAGKRNRSLPFVAMLDDHEIHNDVVGLGSPQWFAEPAEDLELPGHNPWRIASRDAGTIAWERFVGWSTPVDSLVEHAPILMGEGVLSADGILRVDRLSHGELGRLDSELASSLIVWPESIPYQNEDLRSEPAGVYRVEEVFAETNQIVLNPSPAELAPALFAETPERSFPIRFSVSRPRFSSFRLGAAEIIILDTRTEKGLWKVDPLAPEASLLGDVQYHWLIEKIRNSSAKVLLIASSVNFTIHNGFSLSKRDSWTAFQHERDEIFRELIRRDKPVFLLTGDWHATAVRKLNSKIYEIVCGAWSNHMAKGISDAQEEVTLFGSSPEMLYVGPDDTAQLGWDNHVSILSIGPGGQEATVQILNVVTNQVKYEHAFFETD